MITYIHIIFTFLFILILFYCINKLLKNIIKENYQGFSDDFLKYLDDNHIKYDKVNKILYLNGKEIDYKNHFNTKQSTINARNKIITSQILSYNNIPIPKFAEIDLSDNIDNIINLLKINNIKYPIVMKPINGTFGIDVYTNIDNKDELIQTIILLKKYNKVIAEEQIDGDCYRIFVFNKKVIDIIKREKPYILGDNIHTVEELINKRNDENIKLKLLPIKNLSESLILKQGYNMNSIPELNKKIIISNVINMHNGARIFRIPIENIPKKNIDLFIKVNNVMDINCSGIDYLSNDITIPYDKNNSKILEVNGTPDTEIHNKISGINFYERIMNTFL
jgi:cyanophycin synthetase